MFSTKVNLLYPLYSTARRCCLLILIKQNCSLKTSKNFNFTCLISLPVFASRTNLILHNISAIPNSLCKSTIRPCMEYCCHVWAGAPSCYLNRWINYKNRYAGLLVFHLLPLLNPWAHRRNVASLSLFYRYYFGRCSSELVQLIPLPYSQGRSTRYSDRLHDFSVTIPRR